MFLHVGSSTVRLVRPFPCGPQSCLSSNLEIVEQKESVPIEIHRTRLVEPFFRLTCGGSTSWLVAISRFMFRSGIASLIKQSLYLFHD
jgi:hypothetical protein